jgi:PmbA protein
MLERGDTSADDIVKSVHDGLYLTTLMGFGINLTTGDFSRGAAGIWIENGELTYPVTEINVSGNLKDMLRDIEMVGSDLTWLAGSAAPTVKMSRLMVSGL